MKYARILAIETWLAVAACATAALIASRPTQASEWWTCDSGTDWILWEGDEPSSCDACAVMTISTTSFPTSGSQRPLLEAAMVSWNSISRSRFTFSVTSDTDGTHDFDNGENEVYRDSLDGSGGTLAVTYLMSNNTDGWQCIGGDDANISEADLAFDSGDSWSNTTSSYPASGSSPYNFELVAAHELGHVLGMDHEDDVLAIMNSFYPLGGIIGPYMEVKPGADDRDGVRTMYSTTGTSKADLVLSNYKRTGSGTSSLVSAPSPSLVPRGSHVTVEYTFMNIGSASSGSFNIGFYLSTNATYDASDTLLGSNVGASCSSGGLGTYTRTLTIPTSASTGYRYVIVRLDRDSTVAEWDEDDNYLAHTSRIYVN